MVFCVLFSLLFVIAGIGVLGWLGGRRVVRHLRKHPEAARLLAEHVVAPLLLGEEVKEAKDVKEVKKVKATLV